jgi:hypothetical protein
MRIHSILILLGSIHLQGVCGSMQVPRDIETFAANAEACEHLGGEYDAEVPAAQQREIERGVRRYCGAASRQLPVLQARYRDDPAMLAIIRRHANEAVADYRHRVNDAGPANPAPAVRVKR